MRAFIPISALLLLSSVLSLPRAHSPAPKPPSQSAEPVFHPAGLVAAKQIIYPFASSAYGPVILEASINAKGKVEDVVAIRPIASLSEPAIRSVWNWKFKPATLDDKPVASRMTIAVMFNPSYPYSPSPATLPPRAPDHDLPHVDAPFDPPEVISVVQATMPSALRDGSVVLQAKITSSGELNYATVVLNSPPFVPNALAALQKWQFEPAKFNGLPVASTMPIAFVFRVPVVVSP